MKKKSVSAAIAAAMVLSGMGTAVLAEEDIREEYETMIQQEIAGDFQEAEEDNSETAAEEDEETSKTEVVTVPEEDGLSMGEPYINANGVTMVPLRMIGDLVEADYYYDEETQTVHASRGDEVEIVFTVGSAYADVNGYTQEIEPPVMSENGYTMVPLRFICENLGAEVLYEDGRVFVNADPGSEYGDILMQKITNEWIGDSKYGWSMKNPKDMYTSDIYSSVDYLRFMGEGGWLSISIKEKPEQKAIGTLYTREKYNASRSYKLREAELIKGADGYDRFYLLADNGDGQSYYLCTMSDKYIYELTISATEESMPGVRAAADSFKIGFAGEDIYDFAQNRFTEYKKLSGKDDKITIKAPEPWRISEYDTGYELAALSAANGDFSGIWIELYSKEDDVTPEIILQDIRMQCADSANAEDESIGEITAYDNGLCFEITLEDGTEYYAAFEQGEYVYLVQIYIYKGDEETSFGYADDAIDVIMESIVCEDITAEDAGRIIFMQAPRGVYDTETGTYVSFRYPVWWQFSDGSSYYSPYYSYYSREAYDDYMLSYSGIYLTIGAEENNLLEDKDIDEMLEALTDEKAVVVRIGGINFKSVTVNDESNITELYIAVKDGILYTISLEYSEESDKSEAVKTAREIIGSITIKQNK